MSDPVSVVIAVVAVASIAQRIGHLAGKIHQVENAKLDQIYYRLTAEKAKTKGWVNQIRNRNGEDFLSSIDPAELEEVSVLLRKLEEYHDYAKLKYQGVEAARKKGIMPPGTMKAKLRLFKGAFDDLKVMADTLAAMNEALRSMIPLLPAYDVGPAASSPSSDPIQASQISAVAEIGSDEIQSQSFAAAPSEEAADSAAKCSKQVSTSIERMWRLALEGLIKIAMVKREKLTGNCAGRLKLWGVGLFEAGYSLDDVLVSRSLMDSPFYQILIRTLANILLFEEHEIKCITANRSASNQRRLLQVKSEITALLGTDELVVLAVEDWYSQLALNHDNTEVGPIAKTREHAQNHTRRMDISIARAVENLFDLLPGIRAERHAYCHDKESNRESERRKKETADASLATVPLVQKQFEDVKFIIAARDKMVRDEGRNDVLGPTFAKVQARLEEFKLNGERTAKSVDSELTGDLQLKLEEMSKTIVHFIDLVNPQIVDLSARRTGDSKTSLENLERKPRLGKEANEALRDLVGTLDNDLSTLFSGNSQEHAV